MKDGHGVLHSSTIDFMKDGSYCYKESHEMHPQIVEENIYELA